jgi:UTP-glucose-1-phosphate uridylyltransferase/mevalonate kinase
MKIFIPGRICLFGEHSDWAGGYRRINAEIEKGYTVITGTNHGIHADVKPHPSKLIVTSRLPDGSVMGPREVPMEKRSLLAEAEQGGFFSYMAGVAYQALTQHHVKGLEIHCHTMDLPLKKGLSSSAAICVLVVRAFNQVYDLKMTRRGEMEIAYQGEILTPSRCGRMDQACAYGQRPLLMTFDGDLLHVDEIAIRKPLYLLIVDLRARKDTREILAKLNHCYPFPQDDMERNVHRCLGEINKEIVSQAVEAIRRGDARAVGELMTRAQKRFDELAAPACPSELTAPILHKVLAHEALRDLVWGGKGVGSQGDGCAQFVARDAESRDRAMEIIERDFGMPCLELDIAPPSKVRKAVIPVAGFGARLYPASKATNRVLFPIVDRDGVAKPVVLSIIEEALSAGVEEVCLVISREDRRVFDEFFNVGVPIQNFHKLPTRFRDYSDYLRDIGRRIHFVVQEKQEGFGHAVYCAREWVGQEPFLLLLGDHLYRSQTDVSCARQLLDVYEKRQVSAVGLMVTPEDSIGNFGAATGDWTEEENVLNVTEFAEKPTVDYARAKLRVEGVEEGRYLTVFGQYIIRPEIFQILEDQIEGNLRQAGEFQLTPALEDLRKRDGFLGALVQGRRYDIGAPEAYVQTVAEFSRNDG